MVLTLCKLNVDNDMGSARIINKISTLQVTQDRSTNSQAHLFAAYKKRATCGEPRIQKECKTSGSLRLFQTRAKSVQR